MIDNKERESEGLGVAEYLEQLRLNEFADFATYWRVGQQDAATNFPAQMSETDWDKQFLFWMRAREDDGSSPALHSNTDRAGEAASTMTVDRALRLYLSENEWLRKNLRGESKCGCGACHICAYRFLESLTTQLEAAKQRVAQLEEILGDEIDRAPLNPARMGE